MLIFERTSNKI